MTELKLYNTLSREKEVFEPLQENLVRVYTCGLTVYDSMHLGHARTFCFWDLLFRTLRRHGYKILSLVNYTDIDDKIIERARERDISIEELTDQYIAEFVRDCDDLHIERYSLYCRTTEHIDWMIDTVKRLIDNGHAYATDEGDVYFSVRSFDDYGKLSGREVDDLLEGARVEPDPAKRDPADFALWKAQKEPDEPAWDSPWGKGRPGWHIECSSMSEGYLGCKMDIHGGGSDLIFPHHENEIAQSEGAGCEQFARYWLHPAHLIIEGEKMSKSLGNFITVREALDEYGYELIRWAFAQVHYRQVMDFSADSIESYRQSFDKITGLLERLAERALEGYSEREDELLPVDPGLPGRVGSELRELSENAHGEFDAALADDVNTPEALAVLHDFVSEANSREDHWREDPDAAKFLYRRLDELLFALGIERIDRRLHPNLALEASRGFVQDEGGGETGDEYRSALQRVAEVREEAREDGNYERADLIRDVLEEAGIEVEDTPSGPRIGSVAPDD